MQQEELWRDVMIGYNNQQQLTRLCSFQEYFVLLQSPPRNNGNQGQHAIIRCSDHTNLFSSEQFVYIMYWGLPFQGPVWRETFVVLHDLHTDYTIRSKNRSTVFHAILCNLHIFDRGSRYSCDL